MDIVTILKDSIEISKKNYIIFVPAIALMVIVSVISLILIGGGALSMGLMGGEGSSGAMMASLGTLMGLGFLVGIISMVLSIFAHGMSVGMAKEAIDKGSTSINSGINIAVSRFVPLLIGTILVGIIVGIGMMLLVIPGLIAAFLLMFTFVAIVVDNIGAVEAMKKSFEIVKSHLSDSVVFFIAMIVVGVIFGIANMILNVIPILGQILGMALVGVCVGYMSIVIVKVYSELTSK